MRRTLAGLAAIVVLALGGCAAPDDVAPTSASPTTEAAEAPSRTEPAPTWDVGQWWLYEVSTLTGGVQGGRPVNGTVNISVGAIDAVPSVAEEGYFLQISENIDPPDSRAILAWLEGRAYDQLILDTANLNAVYSDEWHKRRTAVYDFPLYEGKTWTYRCCGDTPRTQRVSVHYLVEGPWDEVTKRASHPVWTLSYMDSGNPEWHSVVVFSPKLEFVYEAFFYGGRESELRETWRVVDYGSAAAV